MPPLPFPEARRVVVEKVLAQRTKPPAERVHLADAHGRILARSIQADRDYPPTARSVRDGFAVRSQDLPGVLKIVGEVRAGESQTRHVEAGEAIEIMTGAPVPDGADCVVMVEHVTVAGDRVTIEKALEAGTHVNSRGSEAKQGEELLPAGRRVGYPEVALMASAGAWEVEVYWRPKVAIIATGDELVEEGTAPAPHQIRNSNAYSLAAQVRMAGGEPLILPVARDTLDETRKLIAEGLRSDLLLLSGGVSAGKYDVVEAALSEFGAEFYFDRVLIQPGQPLVFGFAQETFFFGLPGNPASTMVCFELFARAAIELLQGSDEAPLPLLEAELTADFSHRPGLTRFLPARLSSDGRTVAPVRWTGSSDIAAVARGNGFLVAEPDRPSYKSGERIRVLLRDR